MSAKPSTRRSANELESDPDSAASGRRTRGQPVGQIVTPLSARASEADALGRGRLALPSGREGLAAPHFRRKEESERGRTRRRPGRTLWSWIETHCWQVITIGVILIAALAVLDPPIR